MSIQEDNLKGIADAIREKKGTILPIPANKFAEEIRSIPAQKEGWQPNSTWWDIETILNNDTEDVGTGGKAIFLLTNGDASTELYFISYFYKIKTSDGAVYELNTTHKWNDELDKECAEGYKTRYVIGYTTIINKDFGAFAKNILKNSLLYCYFIKCNFNSLSFGGNASYDSCGLLQGVKMKDCAGSISSLNYAYTNCKCLEYVEFPNDWTRIATLQNTFASCLSLKYINLPDTYVNVSNINNIFLNCNRMIAVKIPSSWTKLSSFSPFSGCVSLTSILNDKVEFINASLNIQYDASTKTPNLNRQSILTLFANLMDRTTTTALTLYIGVANLDKMTNEEKLIATNKNWILA